MLATSKVDSIEWMAKFVWIKWNFCRQMSLRFALGARIFWRITTTQKLKKHNEKGWKKKKGKGVTLHSVTHSWTLKHNYPTHQHFIHGCYECWNLASNYNFCSFQNWTWAHQINISHNLIDLRFDIITYKEIRMLNIEKKMAKLLG
jgi:hypothetical protein